MRKSSACMWGEGAHSLQSCPGAWRVLRGRRKQHSLDHSSRVAGGGPKSLSGCQSQCSGMLLSIPDQSCFSGSLQPPLGGQQSPVPGTAVENSLCNHSFAFLFPFLFWFYLTDLLKKQRGNTNDMFNTDQLMALQHPKEQKHHIITSHWCRLRSQSPA